MRGKSMEKKKGVVTDKYVSRQRQSPRRNKLVQGEFFKLPRPSPMPTLG